MAIRPLQTTTGHEVDLQLAAELLGQDPAFDRVDRHEAGLHVCPACERPFVAPGEVREVVDVDRVRLDLGCANCGWETTAVHHDRELSALDVALDRSFADLLWTLEVVWIANEESAIERFRAALEAGAIVPEDF